MLQVLTNGQRFYVSTSLINAWVWTIKMGDYSIISDYVNRKEKETNDLMQKGLDFEDDVCGGKDEVFSPIIENGVFQAHIKRHITTSENIQVCLHGFLDVLKGGVIYDIKYTKKYLRGKYFENVQHAFYMYLVPESDYFEYLVFDGKEHYTERYENEIEEVEKTVMQTLEMFFDWLLMEGNEEIAKHFALNFNTEPKKITKCGL